VSARALFATLAPALFLAAGCSISRVVSVPEATSAYDRLDGPARARFLDAREQFLAGDVAQARANFERLLDEAPDIVPFGIWWQECEAALGGVDALKFRSEERAVLRPGVGAELLAARAQDDEMSAQVWLARAEVRDPDCAWIHQARAFLAMREGHMDEARLALERALASDPGHLAARRLEVRLLVRDGATEAARMRLAGWIARAKNDPRVLPRDLADAQLDFALLSLGTLEVDDAELALGALDPQFVEPWRLAAAEACVAHERGDFVRARRRVEDARASAPREILPAVQEALLFDDAEPDPFRARAAWVAVRELAATSDDLLGAFETLRARVRIERIDRDAAAAARVPDEPR